MYSLIVLVCLVQIGRIVYYRHNRRSFQAGFLYLALAFAGLRVLYYLATLGYIHDADESAMCVLVHVSYHLPLLCQFAMYTLLMLFFAYLCHRAQWAQSRFRFILYAALLNGLWLVFYATRLAFYIAHHCARPSHIEWKVIHACDALLSLLLILALTALSLRLLRKTRMTNANLLSYPHTLKRITVLTVFLQIVLTSRVVYNILAVISISLVVWKSDDATVFVLLVVWEIIPTVVVLIYFYRIPATKIGQLSSSCWPFRSREPSSPPSPLEPLAAPPQEDMSASLVGDSARRGVTIFVNVKRGYDTDDEFGGSVSSSRPGSSRPGSSQDWDKFLSPVR